MNLVELVELNIKKVFTSDVVTVFINPCQSKSQIYDSIMPIISGHYPNLEYGQIELVRTGQDINGQSENAPHMVIDDTTFKNTIYWEGYNTIYTFYTRSKLEIEGSECSICLDAISNIQRPFRCSHGFCSSCITPWIRNHDTCPTCRAHSSPLYHPPLNYMNSVLGILLNNNNPEVTTITPPTLLMEQYLDYDYEYILN